MIHCSCSVSLRQTPVQRPSHSQAGPSNVHPVVEVADGNIDEYWERNYTYDLNGNLISYELDDNGVIQERYEYTFSNGFLIEAKSDLNANNIVEIVEQYQYLEDLNCSNEE